MREPSPHAIAAEHMRLAISEMRKSSSPGPRVGAVLVSKGEVVAVAHRGPGAHAERTAIEEASAAGVDLRGATLYTTLEPCVRGTSNHESCAELIRRVGLGAVYIGRYDANPEIYRQGWKLLREAGVTLYDFDMPLRSEIDQINEEFAEHFISGLGPTGGAKFDYQLNGGNFEIQFSGTDSRSIVTGWTNRGANSIYAYAARPVRVALATYASTFADVDDPRALDFSHTVPVQVGEIAAFVSDCGAVLVKIIEVDSGPPSGAGRRFVKFQFEVRTW